MVSGNTFISILEIFKNNFHFIVGDSLEAFGKTANQLLQDVQERLVFRAHLYLQTDILNYKPSAGDLAYPEKLEMMEVSYLFITLSMCGQPINFSNEVNILK